MHLPSTIHMYIQTTTCLNETKPLRDDFRPLIKNLLVTMANYWNKEVTERNRHLWHPTSWFPTRIQNDEPVRDIYQKLCDIYYLQLNGFDNTTIDELMDVLTDNFQVHHKMLSAAINLYLDQVPV